MTGRITEHRKIVFGIHEYGHLIAETSGTSYNPRVDQCIAVVDETGFLLGGNTFQGYTGASINTHTAGFVPGWATRDFLWAIFDYPFNQLGCGTVFGQVPASNTRAMKINQKLGFRIIATIDNVFPDGACHVMSMTRDECRWLDIKPRTLRPGDRESVED